MKCVHCDAVLSVRRGAGGSVRCPNCHGVMTIAAGVTRPVTPPGLREAGYPRVNGHQRALLIGINYTGQGNLALSNPINDVRYMRHLLTKKYDFEESCILTLTDNARLPSRRPTKANIMLAMRWLVHDCKPDDSLVFYFSGHGRQLPDQAGDGDEVDRMDEAIRPLDWGKGFIRDDDINEALVRPLEKGVTLHAIIDAAHSGTMLDLPMVYKIKQNGQPDLTVYNPRNGACKNPKGGLAILISGCADGQKTVQIPDQQHLQLGLFTYSFYTAAFSARPLTYDQLLRNIKGNITRELTAAGKINRKLPNGRKVPVQEPQISYSSKSGLDINQHLFVL